MAGKRRSSEGIGDHGEGVRDYVDRLYREISSEAKPHKDALKFIGGIAVGPEDTQAYRDKLEAAAELRQDEPRAYRPVDPEAREGKVPPGEEYAHYPVRERVELIIYPRSTVDIGPDVTGLDYVLRFPPREDPR